METKMRFLPSMICLLIYANVVAAQTSQNEYKSEPRSRNESATSQTHAAAQTRKRDILGLSPGMSTEEVRRFLTTKSWRCMPLLSPMAGPGASTCETELGQLNLRVALHLPGEPLIYLRLFFRSADTRANIANSISEQYGVNTIPEKDLKDMNGNGLAYQWKLVDALFLILDISADTQMLDLHDLRIEFMNLEAAKALELKRNPTPRF